LAVEAGAGLPAPRGQAVADPVDVGPQVDQRLPLGEIDLSLASHPVGLTGDPVQRLGELRVRPLQHRLHRAGALPVPLVELVVVLAHAGPASMLLTMSWAACSAASSIAR